MPGVGVGKCRGRKSTDSRFRIPVFLGSQIFEPRTISRDLATFGAIPNVASRFYFSQATTSSSRSRLVEIQYLRVERRNSSLLDLDARAVLNRGRFRRSRGSGHLWRGC